MSTGKIELSVGAVKIANKYELFTEEEISNIDKIPAIEDELEETVKFEIVGEGTTVPPISGGGATSEYDDTEIREMINETNTSLDDITRIIDLKSGVEINNYTYSDTNTCLDGTNREFINTKSESAIYNTNKIKEVFEKYGEGTYKITKGHYVFNDEVEITIPNGMNLIGDGIDNTILTGIRLVGNVSNIKITDITFEGKVDITPPKKVYYTSYADYDSTKHFPLYSECKIYNVPHNNNNRPIIINSENSSNSISNFIFERCKFKNVDQGITFGKKNTNTLQENIIINSCIFDNIMWHGVGINSSKKAIVTNNIATNLYCGMVADFSGSTKYGIFSNNVAIKCSNLVKNEDRENTFVVGDFICTNNIYEGFSDDDVHLITDYIIRTTNGAIITNNNINVYGKFRYVVENYVSYNQNLKFENNSITFHDLVNYRFGSTSAMVNCYINFGNTEKENIISYKNNSIKVDVNTEINIIGFKFFNIRFNKPTLINKIECLNISNNDVVCSNIFTNYINSGNEINFVNIICDDTNRIYLKSLYVNDNTLDVISNLVNTDLFMTIFNGEIKNNSIKSCKRLLTMSATENIDNLIIDNNATNELTNILHCNSFTSKNLYIENNKINSLLGYCINYYQLSADNIRFINNSGEINGINFNIFKDTSSSSSSQTIKSLVIKNNNIYTSNKDSFNTNYRCSFINLNKIKSDTLKELIISDNKFISSDNAILMPSVIQNIEVFEVKNNYINFVGTIDGSRTLQVIYFGGVTHAILIGVFVGNTVLKQYDSAVKADLGELLYSDSNYGIIPSNAKV